MSDQLILQEFDKIRFEIADKDGRTRKFNISTIGMPVKEGANPYLETILLKEYERTEYAT